MAAAFDLVALIALVFIALALISVPKRQHSAIETLGYYAVTLTWTDGSTSDVDLYVRDPAGNITYYANSDPGGLYLEHDDLGRPDKLNYERILLRTIERGEYVVNVHAYRLEERRVPVTVTIWRLRGQDREIASKSLVLIQTGQEKTVFRFVPPHTFHDPVSADLVG